VDYKTSKVDAKEITGGAQFQLALYAIAAETALFPDTPCSEAIYLTVGRTKSERKRIALSRDDKRNDWEERVAIARETISKCVAGIRAGQFHPNAHTAPCKGCPAERVCRFDRRRLERKAKA